MMENSCKNRVDWGNSERGPCGEPIAHNGMCVECLRRMQWACRKQIMELRGRLHTAEADYKELTREIELT